MFEIQIILALLIILITSQNSNGGSIPDCDYFDTVDLSGITPYSNGSYPYENVLIPPELTGVYDYVITGNSDERIPVEKHVRGCACKLRSCVRFCCHHNQLFKKGQCFGETDKVLNYNPILNITLNNGSVVERHVLNEFVVQRHLPMPCKDLPTYHIDNREEGYQWTLFENGTFMRNWDNVSSNKREYCLQPFDFDTEIRLVPHKCADAPKTFLVEKILICLSLLCFLITIFVYLFVPKLRNLHGKCFVCYLISLFIGYSFLLLDILEVGAEDKLFCSLTGYIGYFGIMAAFFWLTVISLDLWTTFRGTHYNVNNFAPRNRFLVYSLYAWGMALILTILIYIIDIFTKASENLLWIPGVAYYECWVKTQDWSAMIYFYGPMLILILFNTILFIMTAERIMELKRKTQKVLERQNRKRRIQTEDTYGLFLRLIVIMGISWSLEIISYLASNNTFLIQIFQIVDYFHYCQGVIIFILFVLKRNVIKLIIDRVKGRYSEEDTNVSDEDITLQEGKSIISS